MKFQTYVAQDGHRYLSAMYCPYCGHITANLSAPPHCANGHPWNEEGLTFKEVMAITALWN